MPIKGEDNRSIVENFNLDGIKSVVAVDFPVPRNDESEIELSDGGTGNLIAPNHVLTAGHVIFGEERVKVSTGENAASLSTRTRRLLLPEDFNATNLSYPAPGYNGNDRSGIGGNDLGLITLNESIGEPSQYIGLVAFVNPKDAKNLQVTTAGFPGAVEVGDFSTNDDGSLNINDSISKNAPFLITDENNVPFIQVFKGPDGSYLTDAVQMFTATGIIDDANSDGQFSLNSKLDSEFGQSGSGYWTYLEGDSEPRVLGVYSFGGDPVAGGFFDDNFGALITADAYDNIVTTMQPTLRANNIAGNDLPENAIVGSDESDNIQGSYRRERILGNEGQDTISGGEADDRLEGGAGYDVLNGGKDNDLLQGDGANDYLNGGEGDKDVAVFSDDFENYDYSELTGSTFGVEENGLITIEHIDGTYADGKDTLVGIEWAQFQDEKEPRPLGAPTPAQSAAAPGNEPDTVTRIVPLPLTDGVEATETVRAVSTAADPNPNDPPTPPYVSLTAPVAMLDGDIEYSLNISPYEPNIEYNISYVIDNSGSMDAGEMQAAKDAYIDLTNYFINAGTAENINFNIITFNRYASSISNLLADETISVLNGLSATNSNSTSYHDALSKAESFFNNSPSADATNIAYFLSDGRSYPSGNPFAPYNPYDPIYNFAAMDLRDKANVQAFGIDNGTVGLGNVSPSQIHFVDSNQGVLVSDVANLSSELQKSGLADNIDYLNIMLDGEIVETLTPDQLTDSPLGLTYSGTVENEGEIDELDVSIDAKNRITAEVVFTPESKFATTAVEHTVTAGESEAVDEQGNPIDQSGNSSGNDDPFERQLNGSDGNDEITLGYVDRGANGGNGGDEIVGNNRDNILNGGKGNDRIYAHGGNDTITTGEGIDLVDAGEGIDTVVYGDVTYQNNSNIFLSQSGNVVNYNNTDTLTNIEYLKFADVKVDADNLEIVPDLEISNDTIVEGSSDSYTLELNVPAPSDIVFDYSTVDGEAIAGEDYTTESGTITIPAGETTANLEIETLVDNLYEEATESFSINITGLTGATFNDNSTESVIPIYIENKGRDKPMILNGNVGNNTLRGGTGNDSLAGNDGNDVLLGRDGDDTLKGGRGNDKLYGQNEADNLVGNEGNDTLNGNGGYDRITEFGNVDYKLTNTQLTGLGTDKLVEIETAYLAGGGGNNTIDAGDATAIKVTLDGAGGNDSMVAGTRSDVLFGNSGNDTLKGNVGNDQLYGQNQADNLVGGEGDDTLNGGGGYDRITEFGNVDYELTNTTLTGLGTDTIVNVETAYLAGGNGNNTIDAEDATTIKVTLDGGAGNDSVVGGTRSDVLFGNSGSDILKGNTGNDQLFGQNQADNLVGGEGDDTLNGGGGYDRITEFGNVDYKLTNTTLTGKGTDKLFNIETAYLAGGGGNNTIDAGDATTIKVTLDGGAGGNDSMVGGTRSDILYGQSGNDTLKGNAGNDAIFGQNGNDQFFGGDGNDTLDGGVGYDRLFETADVDFILTNTTLTGVGTDIVRKIELARLAGGASNNIIDASGSTQIQAILVGESGNDTLMGSQIGDTLYGGAGNDKLDGNAGNDTLVGNSGADIFVLKSAMGTDLIKDFQNGVDKFELPNSLSFSDLGIASNSNGAGVLITDTTNNNELLAVVNGVYVNGLDSNDFVSAAI